MCNVAKYLNYDGDFCNYVGNYWMYNVFNYRIKTSVTTGITRLVTTAQMTSAATGCSSP